MHYEKLSNVFYSNEDLPIWLQKHANIGSANNFSKTEVEGIFQACFYPLTWTNCTEQLQLTRPPPHRADTEAGQNSAGQRGYKHKRWSHPQGAYIN